MTQDDFLADMLDSEERTVRVTEANLRSYVQNTDKLIARNAKLQTDLSKAMNRIRTLEIAYEVLKDMRPKLVKLDVRG